MIKENSNIEDYDISQITTGGSGSILSSLYRTILWTLGITAPLFNKLIFRRCFKDIDKHNLSPTTLKSRETNLFSKLMEKEFTFETFMMGIDLLNVKKIKLILLLNDPNGKEVKRYESDEVLSDTDDRGYVTDKYVLMDFINKIFKAEGIEDFDNGFYPVVKRHYSYMTNSKAGKSFISNIARAFRSKTISWIVFYRMICAFGYTNGSLNIVLYHSNGKKTIHNKPFYIN